MATRTMYEELSNRLPADLEAMLAYDWAGYKASRDRVVRESGQWVGLMNENFIPVMDIDDWEGFSFPEEFIETGSYSITIPGEIKRGVRNPLVDYLLQCGSTDPDGLINDALTIVAERDGQRRFARVLDLIPEGGQEHPKTLTVTAVDGIEYLKHLPLWADPSNRSKIVQLQYEDVQRKGAELVSRKFVGRNLLGYQQPSMLHQPLDGAVGSSSMTDDYGDPARWKNFNPLLNTIVCSPVASGLPSENCVVAARWDNAWDLLQPTWAASGVRPIVTLWLPGDPQPFPEHATLLLPTVVVDFRPCSTVTGARTVIGQSLRSLQRKIEGDDFTSITQFADVDVPTAAGDPPWVVFELLDSPKLTIRKSTDHTFLVGSKSPKIVNDVVKAGIKTAVATMVSMVPGIGAPAAELIRGVTDIVAEMSADRFLNLNEHVDQDRKRRHGRSGYISIAKKGEANSTDAIQKAWQAKTETAGGIAVEFDLDDPYPYVPGVHFQVGDTVGVTAWGEVWAAYVSQITWTSTPGDPRGYTVRLGDLRQMTDPEALAAKNVETIRARLSRLVSTVN